MDLKQAEQNFKYADKEFVSISILQLKAAEDKVNILLDLKMKKAETLRELPPEKIDWFKKLTIDSIPPKREIKIKFVNLGSNKRHLAIIGKNF